MHFERGTERLGRALMASISTASISPFDSSICCVSKVLPVDFYCDLCSLQYFEYMNGCCS